MVYGDGGRYCGLAPGQVSMSDVKQATLKSGARRGFASLAVLGAVALAVFATSVGVMLNASGARQDRLLAERMAKYRLEICAHPPVAVYYNSLPSSATNRDDGTCSWQNMVWTGEILSAAAIGLGRRGDVTGMGISAIGWSSVRRSQERGGKILATLENNRVKSREKALANMFVPFWGASGAVLVPSARDQLEIEYVSSRMLAFPGEGGVDEAKAFWTKHASGLIAADSPLSFMDIVW